MTVVTAVRLGALGDLVMTLPALRAVHDLQLVTDSRYVPLLRHALPGAVVTDPSALDVLRPADEVLDLHGVPRSRRLLPRVPRTDGSTLRRTPKEDLRRRALLVPGLRRFGGGRTWPERHGALVGGEGRPRLEAPNPTGASSPLLGLVVGAGHPGKAWARERHEQLAAAWSAATGGRSRSFAGPGEEPLTGDAIDPWDDGGDLLRLLDGLAGCDVVVAADTGPLHLAGALGRPVVGLFGPTPVDAGFWVWEGVALRPAVSCAPCSMHGAGPCWRLRRRCLEHRVEDVLAAALGLRP